MKTAQEIIDEITREQELEEYNSRADVICDKLNNETKEDELNKKWKSS